MNRAMFAIVFCAAVVAVVVTIGLRLWYYRDFIRGKPAHRQRQLKDEPKFVVWYRAPLSDRIEYLAFMPPYDYGQFSAPEGEWYYTDKYANAYRFDNRESAMRRAPTYDGSSNLDDRTGVVRASA